MCVCVCVCVVSIYTRYEAKLAEVAVLQAKLSQVAVEHEAALTSLRRERDEALGRARRVVDSLCAKSSAALEEQVEIERCRLFQLYSCIKARSMAEYLRNSLFVVSTYTSHPSPSCCETRNPDPSTRNPNPEL